MWTETERDDPKFRMKGRRRGERVLDWESGSQVMLMLLESENALNKLGSLSLSLECESKIKSEEIPRKKEIDW